MAKIVGVGLAKRGIGFLITQGAAEALGDEIAKASDPDRDIRTDALKDTGSRFVEDVSTALGEAALPSMDARIARFREGQAAIREMKEGLTSVVDALVEVRMKLPITIIVDELDRCRPTYAIKVLEEIKHLFDVNGVAFVLGLHGEQLAHSVTAAYGSSFDGPSYLRRFFNRRYVLRQVALTPLIQKLIIDLRIPVDRLVKPKIRVNDDAQPGEMPLPEFIASVMTAYGLTARDAFSVMEMLQTSVALTAPAPLLIAYFLPLLINHITASQTDLPEIVKLPKWSFSTYISSGYGNENSSHWENRNLSAMVSEFQNAANMSTNTFIDRYNGQPSSMAMSSVATLRLGNISPDAYANPANYRQLLETVARFQPSEDES